ncbi:hypothetical protein [Halorarius halobius]|uniref:hypothetical protein n=1 Tax=Halorarius halobius TaxID=2962671 RepID=UPI0020CE3803|nr:hypothetical protein [Halorarius halobius]
MTASVRPRGRPRHPVPGMRPGMRRRNALLAVAYLFLSLVAAALVVLLVGQPG